MCYWITAAGMLAALMSVGCAKPGPTYVEIEGTVTMDGNPMEKIRVEFWPEKLGVNSTGVSDAEGKFTLTTIDGKHQGAALGNHKVTLTDLALTEGYKIEGGLRKMEDVDMTQGRKPRIASKYANPMNTDLTVTVTADKAPIELKIQPFAPATAFEKP
jgi:hypothetical protein